MPALTGQRSLAPGLPSCRRLPASHGGRQVCQPRCFSTAEAQRKPRGGLSALASVVEVGFGARPGFGGHGSVAASAQATEVVPMTAEEQKEFDRKYMRSVFDFDRWAAHRSTARYYRHISGLFQSRLVKSLSQPLLYVAGVSTAVCLYQTALAAGVLPEGFPDLEIKSKELFGLTSFALSLLLVFRTNASYERWDGARKMWGLVLNRSRDITRQGLAWIPEERPELRAMLCRWVPAFSKSLMCHLRKGEDIAKELDGILLPHEITAVVKSTHRPNYVLQVLAQIIKEAKLPTAPTFGMDQNLTAFEDCLGGCERILRTPIPLYYTRHTSRFLVIWLTLLPFTMFQSAGWGTVPLSVTIAFLLLGVEEIGVAIEEPFTILALETISGTALTNVRELEAMHGSGSALGASGDVAEGVLAVAAPDMVALAELAEKKRQLEAVVAAVEVAEYSSDEEPLRVSNVTRVGQLAVDGAGAQGTRGVRAAGGGKVMWASFRPRP